MRTAVPVGQCFQVNFYPSSIPFFCYVPHVAAVRTLSTVSPKPLRYVYKYSLSDRHSFDYQKQPISEEDHSILPAVQALRLTPSSTAANPQSSPWLWPPEVMPARAWACSSVRTVRTPKMTGTPVSNWTRMSPWDTASAMYSKCMVSPLIRTPTAMMASKGPPEDSVGRDVRSVVDEPRRSPAEEPEPACAD